MSGAKHPRAKTYKLTSPSNEIYVVTGGLMKFAKKHNLPRNLTSIISKYGGCMVTGKGAGWTIMPESP